MNEETKKILIVDDQKSWYESMSGILDEIKCTLDFAKTYREAQSRLEKEAYDLSIVDIRLHDQMAYNVEGIDLLEWIQKHRRGQPPVIILTGYATPALEQKAEWHGAYAFFEKNDEEKDFDFDKEKFLKTVREALQINEVK